MEMVIEVFPYKGGEWGWRKRSDDERTQRPDSKKYDSRSGAIAAARAAREDEVMVLLRPDGSVYGHLLDNDPPDKSAKHMSIAPAGERSAAV